MATRSPNLRAIGSDESGQDSAEVVAIGLGGDKVRGGQDGRIVSASSKHSSYLVPVTISACSWNARDATGQRNDRGSIFTLLAALNICETLDQPGGIEGGAVKSSWAASIIALVEHRMPTKLNFGAVGAARGGVISNTERRPADLASW